MATLSKNIITVDYVVGSADVSKLKNELDKVSPAEEKAVQSAKKLNNALKETGSEGAKATKEVTSGMNQISSLAKSGAGLLAGFFAVGAIKAMAQEVIGLTAKYEGLQKVLNFTTGSTAGGARAFQFLVETSQKLGTSLEASAAGFKTLSGAASQAGIPLSQQMKIFQDVSKAASAFGLSAEDSKGVFLALGQIISKGTVFSEELRGQIGERIPGAFAIAARSIGVTESELNKLLQSGKVLSKDFIIPFTEELGKVSEKAAGENGLQKNINRISNAFEILKTRVGGALLGDVGQLGTLLQKALDVANKLLERQSDRDASKSLKEYNRALQESEKLSKKAVETAITNANAQIRGLKDQFNALNEKIAIDGEISEKEQKELDRVNLLITAYRGYRDGLIESSKSKKQLTEQTAILTKVEYDNELKRLQLLTEIRKVEQNSKAGLLAADVAFLEAKLQLQTKYNKDLEEITDLDIELTLGQSKKAHQALLQKDSKYFMESMDILAEYRKQRKA